jgi:hypothetical protein
VPGIEIETSRAMDKERTTINLERERGGMNEGARLVSGSYRKQRGMEIWSQEPSKEKHLEKKKKFSFFPEPVVSSSLYQVKIIETYNPS